MNKTEQITPYNLRIPKALKKRLEQNAKRERRSLNQYLVIELEKIATKPLTA